MAQHWVSATTSAAASLCGQVSKSNNGTFGEKVDQIPNFLLNNNYLSCSYCYYYWMLNKGLFGSSGSIDIDTHYIGVFFSLQVLCHLCETVHFGNSCKLDAVYCNMKLMKHFLNLPPIVKWWWEVLYNFGTCYYHNVPWGPRAVLSFSLKDLKYSFELLLEFKCHM